MKRYFALVPSNLALASRVTDVAAFAALPLLGTSAGKWQGLSRYPRLRHGS